VIAYGELQRLPNDGVQQSNRRGRQLAIRVLVFLPRCYGGVQMFEIAGGDLLQRFVCNRRRGDVRDHVAFRACEAAENADAKSYPPPDPYARELKTLRAAAAPLSTFEAGFKAARHTGSNP